MLSCRKNAKQLWEDKILENDISSLPCLFNVEFKKHIKMEKVSQKLLHLQISTSKLSALKTFLNSSLWYYNQQGKDESEIQKAL